MNGALAVPMRTPLAATLFSFISGTVYLACLSLAATTYENSKKTPTTAVAPVVTAAPKKVHWWLWIFGGP
jgi:uncharacterized membrane protein YdcZ (DUF606 family)